MQVFYRKGDITSYSFEPSATSCAEIQKSKGAIVNAANEGLWPGGGVCGAIFGAIRKSGSRNYDIVMDEIEDMPFIGRSRDRCPVGDAKVTTAAGLKCDYIFHAVAPTGYSYPKLKKQYAAVYSCLMRCLELGEEKKVGGIAFNFIGTGIFGCNKQVVSTAFKMACQDFNKKNPKYVEESVMYVFLPQDLPFFEHLPVKKFTSEIALENSSAQKITNIIQKFMEKRSDGIIAEYIKYHSIIKKQNMQKKKTIFTIWKDKVTLIKKNKLVQQQQAFKKWKESVSSDESEDKDVKITMEKHAT